MTDTLEGLLVQSIDSSPPVKSRDDFQPNYSYRGSILFDANDLGTYDAHGRREFEITVLEYDGSSSLQWMEEGLGITYWIGEVLDIPGPGRYILEGVYGEYHRGDWSWGEDDDEDWYFGDLTRADGIEYLPDTPDSIMNELDILRRRAAQHRDHDQVMGLVDYWITHTIKEMKGVMPP